MDRKKKLKFAAGVVGTLSVGTLVLANVMVPELNPPQRHTGHIVSAKADAVLRQACFDCHSNESTWPWYANVPFVSMLVAHDIKDGREELNFSEWDSYSEGRKHHKLAESIEEMEEGEMPMWVYTLTHPEAELSPEQIAMLRSEIRARYGNVEESSRRGHSDDHDDHDYDDHDYD
jgi:hypothetical protein